MASAAPDLAATDICGYQAPQSVVELPTEVLHHCMTWNTPKDLGRCSGAGNHKLQQKAEHDDIWRQLLRRDFPNKGRPSHTSKHRRKEVYAILHTGEWKERNFSDRPAWQRFLILLGCLVFSIPLTLYLSPQICSAIYTSCIQPALDAWDDAAYAVDLENERRKRLAAGFKYEDHTWLKQRHLRRRIPFRDRPLYQKVLIVAASIPACPIWVIKYRRAVVVGCKRACRWTITKICRGVELVGHKILQGSRLLLQTVILNPARWINTNIVTPVTNAVRQYIIMPMVYVYQKIRAAVNYCAQTCIRAVNYCRRQIHRFCTIIYNGWRSVVTFIQTQWRRTTTFVKQQWARLTVWLVLQWNRLVNALRDAWDRFIVRPFKIVKEYTLAKMTLAGQAINRTWLSFCQWCTARWISFANFLARCWAAVCTFIHNQLQRFVYTPCRRAARFCLDEAQQLSMWVHSQISRLLGWIAACWASFTTRCRAAWSTVCGYLHLRWTQLGLWLHTKLGEFAIWWNAPGFVGLVLIPWLKVKWTVLAAWCGSKQTAIRAWINGKWNLVCGWLNARYLQVVAALHAVRVFCIHMLTSLFLKITHAVLTIAHFLNDHVVTPADKFLCWIVAAQVRLTKLVVRCTVKVWTVAKNSFYIHVVLPVLAICRKVFITVPVYCYSTAVHILATRIVPAVARFLQRFVVEPVKAAVVWLVKAAKYLKRIVKLITSTFYQQVLVPFGRFLIKCYHVGRGALAATVTFVKSCVSAITQTLYMLQWQVRRIAALIVNVFMERILWPVGRSINSMALALKAAAVWVKSSTLHVLATMRNAVVSSYQAIQATCLATLQVLRNTIMTYLWIPVKTAAQATTAFLKACLKAMHEAITSTIRTYVTTPAKSCLAVLRSGVLAFKATLASFWNTVKRMVLEVKTAIVSAVQGAKASVQQGATAMADQVRQMGQLVKEGVMETIRSAQQAKHRAFEWMSAAKS